MELSFALRPGFRKTDLQPRYDVQFIREDEWHSYSESKTLGLIAEHIVPATFNPPCLLNAGSGSHSIGPLHCSEIKLDLFVSPLVGCSTAVCGSVNQLPFGPASFGCIVCVGEVLGYCDPASAIREFSRVLAPEGLLICDFTSSLSIKRRFTKSFGRAADMILDQYNGGPERVWIYHPEYISSMLKSNGFNIREIQGTHTWSALARRLGAPPGLAIELDRQLSKLSAPTNWADLITIVAERSTFESK